MCSNSYAIRSCAMLQKPHIFGAWGDPGKPTYCLEDRRLILDSFNPRSTKAMDFYVFARFSFQQPTGLYWHGSNYLFPDPLRFVLVSGSYCQQALCLSKEKLLCEDQRSIIASRTKRAHPKQLSVYYSVLI